ncbi:hypothetical protein BJ322DRAFT_1213872 [Thelephora terrestris]|uniref:N-acetyltransferase domain-containing protein n=1 Tax=Thelephora terrestris TaxID=56493 RepID=A0A9P6H607_9AGAM|nr:hypothetical protein BJ322DRAFT_1213872 [Thelephora terrestris]
MPIYFTSLEDSATVDNVLAFLEPYVPYTLGLIGNIVNSRPELVRAIRVYTSFEFDFKEPIQRPPTIPNSNKAPFFIPALFSIIALQPREQARFFCSADLKSSDPATPEEEAHVQAFFKEVIPIVAAFTPDNKDGPTLEYDISPVGVKGRGYHIGRAHEKWAPCLDPITIQRSGPLVCLIRPPPSPLLPPRENLLLSSPSVARETPDLRSDRWVISRFSPTEIDFIKTTSLTSRHKAYLESRAHTSIVIHDSDPTDVDVNVNANSSKFKKSNPVAWSTIQADGSFGVLWVEPSHRGLGLGDLALNECINRSETYHGFSGNKMAGTGILGWQWADVSPLNARSVRFFSKQEGWKTGWGTQWITFDPDVNPTTIDWSFRETPTEES